LRRDNAQLEQARRELAEEVERLKRERDRLHEELARLTAALEAAQRAGARQAAPFSKGAPVASPRPSGRRAGAAHGRHHHREAPAHADEIIAVPLPHQCGTCGGRLRRVRVARQWQEELPPPRVWVRRFDLVIGQCTACGRRVQPRHPLQTSDALGAASAQVGPHAVSLLVLLNKQFGLSHGKCAALIREWWGLEITPSAVTQALHRAARQAAPTYADLRAQVRGSPIVTPDETSWKVAGERWWLWVFATAATVVYAIAPGRGFRQASAVLGADFRGTLVHDGWASYREFGDARHQSCVAHLLRHCRELAELFPEAPLPQRVKTVLHEALALRQVAADLAPAQLARRRDALFARLLAALDTPVEPLVLQRFVGHLARQGTAIFEFLFDPAVEATNWRAEQALRPAVVNRKVSGGNRSVAGAQTQQVLTSVIQTARLRDLNPRDVLVALLRAPGPTPSPQLTVP
jgi:transposase